MFHRYLYGFEDYCTSTGITFRMDLPFKATGSSHTDSSKEGPAERTNVVEPTPDPETSLGTKNIVKVTIPPFTASLQQWHNKTYEHLKCLRKKRDTCNLVGKSP